MDVIKSVAWFHEKDGKILCVRTKGKDKFYIPGGKIHQDESPKQALVREIKEELNLDLDFNTISYVTTIIDKAHGFETETIVSMQCFYAICLSLEKMAVSAEIDEIKWISKDDSLEVCAPACQRAIKYVFSN